jgi:hypothetical protein
MQIMGGEIGKMDHTLLHFEIPAQDVEKLKSFYEKVFDWKILQYPGPFDYWVIQSSCRRKWHVAKTWSKWGHVQKATV